MSCQIPHLRVSQAQGLTRCRKPSFDVNLAQLEKQYKNLQKKVHPDLQSGREDVRDGACFAQRSATLLYALILVQGEREIADDISAQCNDGYQILRDPIQRGQYLVSAVLQCSECSDVLLCLCSFKCLGKIRCLRRPPQASTLPSSCT